MSPDRDMLTESESRKTRGRVLVAEDDKEMRSLLCSALQAAGFEVTECADGHAFVDLIVTPTPGVDFDLIVSDVRMPGYSGLEVLDAGRLLEGFPPTILMTAFGTETLSARARQLGAKALLNKPFDIDTLVDKVGELLSPRLASN